MSAHQAIATLALLLCALASPTSTLAQASNRRDNPCSVHAEEAARVARLPRSVVTNVMRAESGGNPRARSYKGAIGCMQIMPATWRELARRYPLGKDPWHPRMNMLAGALYLAELARQFGFPGAYAAYNAGPARYARHLSKGEPLPAETRVYTARIAAHDRIAPKISPRSRWQVSRLFALAQEQTSEPEDGGAGTGADEPIEAAGITARDTLFPLTVAREN